MPDTLSLDDPPVYPLRWVSGNHYTDATGTDFVLGAGGVVLTTASEVDLDDVNSLLAEVRADLYRRAFDNGGSYQLTSRFVAAQFFDRLSGLLIDPDEASREFIVCADCADASWRDNSTMLGDADYCVQCWRDHGTCCDDCGNAVLIVDTHYVGGDSNVCARCYENNYSWCESCDMTYHHDDDAAEHNHDRYENCGCIAAGGLTFSVPLAGGVDLSQDTEVNVELPSGVISRDGQYLIRQHVYGFMRSVDTGDVSWGTVANEVLDKVTWEWKVEGRTFPKRLASEFYKTHKIKVPADVLAKIGTTAEYHSREIDLSVAFTRDFNLPPEEFCHEGSCWWGEYAESRCAFKANHGIGLRALNTIEHTDWAGETYTIDECNGRAWVVPVKWDEDRSWTVCPLGEHQGYVVFNGYGSLSETAASRVMTQLTGLSARRINLSVEPLYINSGSAWLLAPENHPGADEAVLYWELNHGC